MARDPREKYGSEIDFLRVRVRRAAIRRLIANLIDWSPLRNPVDGYTLIIGCNVPLARMLSCNLSFLARQDLAHVDRILVILDRPRGQMSDDVEPVMREKFPS